MTKEERFLAAGREGEDHAISQAMLSARLMMLNQVRKAEAARWRREQVMSSPAARKRLQEIEKEDGLMKVRRPADQETGVPVVMRRAAGK